MIRALVVAMLLIAGVSAHAESRESGTMEWHVIPEPARPEDTAISIFSGDYPFQKMAVTIHVDGSVEFGEGFTADDAAREFWKQMGRSLPNRCEVGK